MTMQPKTKAKATKPKRDHRTNASRSTRTINQGEALSITITINKLDLLATTATQRKWLEGLVAHLDRLESGDLVDRVLDTLHTAPPTPTPAPFAWNPSAWNPGETPPATWIWGHVAPEGETLGILRTALGRSAYLVDDERSITFPDVRPALALADARFSGTGLNLHGIVGYLARRGEELGYWRSLGIPKGRQWIALPNPVTPPAPASLPAMPADPITPPTNTLPDGAQAIPVSPSTGMMTGIITRLGHDYGFINDAYGKSAFFHQDVLNGLDFNRIEVGITKVRFELDGRAPAVLGKAPRALNVWPM